MTQQPLIVPELGDVDSAAVIEILVTEGQDVSLEQPLLTLETDKATMDVPSPVAGQVVTLSIQVGETVTSGQQIGLYQPASEDKSSASVPSSVTEDDASKTTPTDTVKTWVVPDLGDVTQAPVIELLVQPGDSFEKEQSLLTLETDKATVEVPAPDSGTLQQWHVAVGDSIQSGQPWCDVKVAMNAAADSEPAATTKDRGQVSAPPVVEKPASANPSMSFEARVAHYQDNPQAGAYAGPATRRLANALGVTLSTIPGTGVKGRITTEDVERYVKAQLTQSQSTRSSGDFVPPMPDIDFSEFGPVSHEALSRIQKKSAQNLHRNWVRIPHVTQFDEADITDLDAFRQKHKAQAKADGVRLTPLVFFMKALSGTLRAFPRFNASLSADGQTLIMKQYCHIGVAVDTPHGLVVPVIRDVDAKSIYALAKELTALSEKARAGELKAKDMKGSSMTISSLGGIGGTAFTPIINAPDVAILGISKSQIKPEYHQEQWVPRLKLPLSLSYDHRVIDGADAARFITHLSQCLADTESLLLL